MRTLTATGIVGPDHMLTLPVPADVSPGPHNVVVVLDALTSARNSTEPLIFAPYPVGPTDPACTYRREDIYANDGR